MPSDAAARKQSVDFISTSMTYGIPITPALTPIVSPNALVIAKPGSCCLDIQTLIGPIGLLF